MWIYPVQEADHSNGSSGVTFYQGIPQIKVIPCMICCEDSRLSCERSGRVICNFLQDLNRNRTNEPIMKRLIIIILIKIVIIFIISSIIEVMLPIYKTMMNFEKQTGHRFYIFIYKKDD